ncbi:hypothetical protein GJAV_G00128050 [Gymnothorax javanicus]|nr:hypothetical protein GJAV_G00128050 [Gymnothorax javanicus]
MTWPNFFWICILMEPDRAAAVAGACVALHNLAMMWKVPLVEDGDADDGVTVTFLSETRPIHQHGSRFPGLPCFIPFWMNCKLKASHKIRT